MNDVLNDKEKREMILGIHDDEEVDNFEEWTEELAQAIARDEGIELTEKHWEVIRFLRVHFQNVGGKMPPVHELSQVLEERFAKEGGLKYLYELFPGGPLNQGGLISGIAVPADVTDPSFGSVQ
ncbi:MAG: TusE/DsrC/DsvC family sulfur relay protein [Gammaproteobacteria bacterium]